MHYWIAPAVLLTDDEADIDMTKEELLQILPVMKELVVNGFVRVGARTRVDMPGTLPEPFEDYYHLEGKEREEYIESRDYMAQQEDELVQRHLDAGEDADTALDALFDFYIDVYSEDTSADDEDEGDDTADDVEDDEEDNEPVLSAAALDALQKVSMQHGSNGAGTVYNYAKPADDDLVLPGDED